MKTPEQPSKEGEQKSSIEEILENNPELARIYNEYLGAGEPIINESGQIVSDGQI